MRKYHLIPISGQETHCYNLPEEIFSPRKQPEPDWNGIVVLEVERCPLRKKCIAIDGNHISRVCDFLLAYGLQEERASLLDHLLCKYGHKVTTRKVVQVRVYDCPVKRAVCIDEAGRCKNIEAAIPIDSSRPHCFVACSLMEG